MTCRKLWIGFTLVCLAAMAGADAKKPNVLLFFTDDQQADTIHALGNPLIHTPNLDKLVERGAAFTRAYMMGAFSGATCIPSRSMLLSGQQLFNLPGNTMNDDAPLLPQHFRQQGYQTFMSGKRHSMRPPHIVRGFTDGGVIMGFAGYYTDKRRMPVHDFNPEGTYPAKTGYVLIGDPPRRVSPAPSKTEILDTEKYPPGPFATEIYVDAAVDFLENRTSNDPLFMYIPLSAPHDPHEAPESIRKLYDPEKIPLPANFEPEHPFDSGHLTIRDEMLAPHPRPPALIKQRIADYYAAITLIDQQFGRLLETLEKTGELDNTIVVFSGDSGLAIGQHGMMGKQNLYEGAGIRVPMIFAGPGIPASKPNESLTYTFDIFPTLCDLCGIPRPAKLDGISQLPVIQGKSAGERDVLYFAYGHHQRAVMDERYKLIETVRAPILRGKGITGERMTQLFDLQEDPQECENLAEVKKYSAVKEKLLAELLQQRALYQDGTEVRKKSKYSKGYKVQAPFWKGYQASDISE